MYFYKNSCSSMSVFIFMKKNLLIILIASLITILFIVYFLDIQIFDEQNIKINNQKEQIFKVKPKEAFDKTMNVSLWVLGKKYNTKIKENSSVLDAMEKIKEENNNFNFKYKEYPSLGIFVEEINNICGGGKYWIYSVNGKEASVGVVKYILKEGDIISWELK